MVFGDIVTAMLIPVTATGTRAGATTALFLSFANKDNGKNYEHRYYSENYIVIYVHMIISLLLKIIFLYYKL